MALEIKALDWDKYKNDNWISSYPYTVKPV